jgi:hypothetical protein
MMIAGQRAKPAQFISAKSATFTNGSDSFVFTSAQAGDLAWFFKSHTATADPSGWNKLTLPIRSSYGWDGTTGAIFWKVLTSTDISAGSVSITTSGGCVCYGAVYRGPSSVVQLGFAGERLTDNVLNCPAMLYDPALDRALIVGYFSANSVQPTLTPPTSTPRANANTTWGFSGFFEYIPTLNYPGGVLALDFGQTVSADSVQFGVR